MKHSITGHLRHRSESIKSRSSTEDPREEDDTTVVEPDQNNVLSHIIAQLRPGADLSRITLPTFILEERSMLERITNFMAHPETLLLMPTIDDPLERFLAVVKFYLSGWHIKPPGVKKPLNPILGETFTCWWDYPDNTKGYYISEQTSHHPPKSSYFFMAPEHHIRVDGTLKPRSRFLGNSAASLMEGISYLRFTNRGKGTGGEKYTLTQPNMYARGILFGKMKYELGDHSYVRCPENNLSADIEFKVKGWVSGGYNAIGGSIKNDKTGEIYYELSGMWNGEMYVKDLKTGQKTPFFDASNAKHTPPKARPLEEQDERESQKLWREVCKAVHVADHALATDEKAKIEDRQRQEAAERQEQGIEWQPKLFRRVDAKPGGKNEGEEDLEWIIDADIDVHAKPQQIVQQILSIAPILPGQKADQRKAPQQQSATAAAPASLKNAPSVHEQPQNDKLIDFSTQPQSPNAAQPRSTSSSSKQQVNTDPKAGYPLHPTSDSKQAPIHEATATPAPPGNPPKQSSLMDDDQDFNDKMASMSMQQPLNPTSRGDGTPIKRLDTETSDTDVFVDAEG